jgi:hypothetical protein
MTSLNRISLITLVYLSDYNNCRQLGGSIMTDLFLSLVETEKSTSKALMG